MAIRYRSRATAIAWVLTVLTICFLLLLPRASGTARGPDIEASNAGRNSTFTPVQHTAQQYINTPITSPYKGRFGELGNRLREVRSWLEAAEHDPQGRNTNFDAAEAVISTHFPFLKNGKHPFQSLRASFTKQRGIVIPAGSTGFRFAAHLVLSLRRSLGCTLPIQIMYAGDADLPPEKRRMLRDLVDDETLEFVDILQLVNDETLQLQKGGWAIKAFATLVSSFEEVIVLDADAVFLQDPTALFNQRAYREKGALLFHDRLLWKGVFKDRLDWWHDQIRVPGPELAKSKGWTEGYGEEGDSGAICVNKRRTDVLLGLLHVAWQNTKSVRDEVTYKITYGDKESFWFGLELAGSTYEFEKHYGAITGWIKTDITDGRERRKVCSFVIAHSDENDRLLWYNGGLLKNKMTEPNLYETPTHWMLDGVWEKGGSKPEMSCKVNGTTIALSEAEIAVLDKSIEWARHADQVLQLS